MIQEQHKFFSFPDIELRKPYVLSSPEVSTQRAEMINFNARIMMLESQVYFLNKFIEEYLGFTIYDNIVNDQIQE